MNVSIPFSLLIVVPTLNSFAILPKLINSLRAQTWTGWRVLFVDGPSGPSHRDWLEQCCNDDSRFTWVEQSSAEPGIFGAMNQGFLFANPDDWIIFWGSDDWAASPTVLEEVHRFILKQCHMFDLFICKERYVDVSTRLLGRTTQFEPKGLLNRAQYARALWLGSTPPHQATLFGPAARAKLDRYSLDFCLSADLDYFLRICRHSCVSVYSCDLEFVHMSDGGVSGVQTKRRLKEVCLAYQRAFAWSWPFPFVFRYIRRIFSLLKHS